MIVTWHWQCFLTRLSLSWDAEKKFCFLHRNKIRICIYMSVYVYICLFSGICKYLCVCRKYDRDTYRISQCNGNQPENHFSILIYSYVRNSYESSLIYESLNHKSLIKNINLSKHQFINFVVIYLLFFSYLYQYYIILIYIVNIQIFYDINAV